MAKKKPPSELVQDYSRGIIDSIERWKSHKENGCNDPGWPDGANMNLLRNHVISYKRQIKELCSEYELPLPPEVYIPGLPYVDNNYFAKPESERAKGIMSRPGWQCYNHETPCDEYNDMELSLF